MNALQVLFPCQGNDVFEGRIAGSPLHHVVTVNEVAHVDAAVAAPEPVTRVNGGIDLLVGPALLRLPGGSPASRGATFAPHDRHFSMRRVIRHERSSVAMVHKASAITICMNTIAIPTTINDQLLIVAS